MDRTALEHGGGMNLDGANGGRAKYSDKRVERSKAVDKRMVTRCRAKSLRSPVAGRSLE